MFTGLNLNKEVYYRIPTEDLYGNRDVMLKGSEASRCSSASTGGRVLVPVTVKQFWDIAAVRELGKFGMRGLHGHKACMWFNLKPEDFLSKMEGPDGLEGPLPHAGTRPERQLR